MSAEILKRVRALTIESSTCTIGDIECAYVVVRPELEPRVPNFVGALGKNEYFISSQVPLRFRRPIIAHEVFCLAKKAEGCVGRCVCAVKSEFEFVARHDRDEYLALRRKFFADLVVYYLEVGGEADFMREITASRDYLNELM